MTAHAIPKTTAKARRRHGAVLTWPFAFIVLVVAMAAAFVSYVLWPNWPSEPVAIDAPALPITIAGALFEIPPATIREGVQRHPGQHERVDLVFSWPALSPPPSGGGARAIPPVTAENAIAAAGEAENDRLFVTIAGLGGVVAPLERLRTIYPRYVAAQANAGPDGLAILPFRGGTPYDGEDLVYVGNSPEQFFARCTRQIGAVRGTCISERALDSAQITIRFPRDWLNDWRSVAAGFDRLAAQLHPERR
jgi:hypothetical protein